MPDAAGARSRFAHWAFLIGVGVLGVAVCGELLVRAARPSGVVPDRHFDPGLYAPDPERGWALRPGYRGAWLDWEARMPTSINAQGYRGPAETPARLGAAQRVVVLGDSVAFGRGVADGEPYPDRLEARLAARGRDVAVFNLAVPGYDTTRERMTLERHVARLDPQLVIVGWFRNDVTDTVPAAEFGGVAVIDGQLVADEEVYRSFRRRMTGSGVLDASMLVNFVRVRWTLWRKGVRLERRVRTAAEHPLPASDYAQTLTELRRIQSLCDERGAGFVLVVHPGLDELDGNEPESVAILRAGLAPAASGGGPSVVSVAREWNARPAADFFQTGDRGHPNAPGHDSIARMLEELPSLAAP